MSSTVLPDFLAASTDPLPTSAADLPLPKENDSGADSDLVLDLIRYTPIPTFVLDANLRVTHVSDSYCSVSGVFDRVQLLGVHLDDLCARVILPSNALVRGGLRAAQETASPSLLDELVNDRVWTLRTVPILVHGRVRCFLMEIQDTTEARRKQLELEEQMYANETFKILVDTVRDYAIFMLDPQGNIATWNIGAETFKGYTKSEIIGKHFSNFYSQEDRLNDKPGRELRDALRDGRCEDEGWRIRKDGSRFW